MCAQLALQKPLGSCVKRGRRSKSPASAASLGDTHGGVVRRLGKQCRMWGSFLAEHSRLFEIFRNGHNQVLRRSRTKMSGNYVCKEGCSFNLKETEIVHKMDKADPWMKARLLILGGLLDPPVPSETSRSFPFQAVQILSPSL